jgi:hypothetical protein
MHQQIHTSKDRSRLERHSAERPRLAAWGLPLSLIALLAFLGAFFAVQALTAPRAQAANIATLSLETTPPAETHSDLLQVACGNIQSQGGQIILGASRVTAWHLLDHCETVPRAHYPQSDLAVLTLGDPGECRNAQLGEAVHFVGYPDLIARGDGLWDFNTRAEFDQGFIIREGVTVEWMNNGDPFPQYNVSIATATQVRPGYSGGPVLAQSDDRVVGMVQAVGTVDGNVQVSFMPVEDICQRLNELIAAEQSLEKADD